TNYNLPQTRGEIKFSDTKSDAVKSMQMAGVIMGKDGNRFDPTATATRAEVSAVLRRYTELVIDKTTAQGLDVNDSGKIVYYENGKLFTGVKTIDGTTYHFGDDGICTKMDAAISDTKKYIVHKVVRGDTLWDIAMKNKCTVAEIVGLNGIKNPNNVPIGTELKIPQQ
ncbi:MAG: LysM peptidoglycan-binding domain-containing protein, partial [Clostridium sp.]